MKCVSASHGVGRRDGHRHLRAIHRSLRLESLCHNASTSDAKRLPNNAHSILGDEYCDDPGWDVGHEKGLDLRRSIHGAKAVSGAWGLEALGTLGLCEPLILTSHIFSSYMSSVTSF